MLVLSSPVDVVASALTRAFHEEGWENPSPGNPSHTMLSIHAYQHGCVVKEVWVSRNWDTVGASLARSVASEGGWALLISPGLVETTLTEWDGDQCEERTVSSPAVTARRVEDKEEEIARALLKACALERIGSPTRAPVRRLEFRRAKQTPLDEVLAAIERGDSVREMNFQGRAAFRIPQEDGARIVPLSSAEADRVRAAQRKHESSP